MTILVTGACGFIGFHLSKRFLSEGEKVVGVDSLDDYYDQIMKKYDLKKSNNENEA